MKRPQNQKVDSSVDALPEKASTLDLPAIGLRIKAARKALGLTQEALAEMAGARSKSGLQDNEAGKNMPGGQMIGALVQAGINANWLLSGDGEMLIASNKQTYPMHQSMSMSAAEPYPGYIALPLYNDVRAAAGHGAVNGHEQADDALMFKEDWIRYELGAKAQDLCLIRVSGDSMEPTLRAGDVILIDHRACRPDREGIYIMRVGEMLLVKRLQALPGGKIRVTSDNPAFDPWTLDLEEFGSDVKVVGRVVWSGRRL